MHEPFNVDIALRQVVAPKPLSWEALLRCGWKLDDNRAYQSPKFVSFGFELVIDGHRLAHVNGIASTRMGAMDDATRQANAWIQRQDRTWLRKFAPALYREVFEA